MTPSEALGNKVMQIISLGSTAAIKQRTSLPARMASTDGAIIEAHNQICVNLSTYFTPEDFGPAVRLSVFS